MVGDRAIGAIAAFDRTEHGPEFTSRTSAC